jgi:hypothetical protein
MSISDAIVVLILMGVALLPVVAVCALAKRLDRD